MARPSHKTRHEGERENHRWVAARLSQIPRLSALADDEAWRTYPQPTSYTVGASFLAYLLDRYGPAPLISIYHASSREFMAAFRAAYGASLEDVEAEWKVYVAALLG